MLHCHAFYTRYDRGQFTEIILFTEGGGFMFTYTGQTRHLRDDLRIDNDRGIIAVLSLVINYIYIKYIGEHLNLIRALIQLLCVYCAWWGVYIDFCYFRMVRNLFRRICIVTGAQGEPFVHKNRFISIHCYCFFSL